MRGGTGGGGSGLQLSFRLRCTEGFIVICNYVILCGASVWFGSHTEAPFSLRILSRRTEGGWGRGHSPRFLLDPERAGAG